MLVSLGLCIVLATGTVIASAEEIDAAISEDAVSEDAQAVIMADDLFDETAYDINELCEQAQIIEDIKKGFVVINKTTLSDLDELDSANAQLISRVYFYNPENEKGKSYRW